MEQPIREESIGHECICNIVAGMNNRDEPVMWDKCTQWVDNPDQPFCDDCEQAKHHQLENQRGRQIHVGGSQGAGTVRDRDPVGD